MPPFVCLVDGRAHPANGALLVQAFADPFSHCIFKCLFSGSRKIALGDTVDCMQVDVEIVYADFPVIQVIPDVEDLVLDLDVVIEKT